MGAPGGHGDARAIVRAQVGLLGGRHDAGPVMTLAMVGVPKRGVMATV